MLYFGIGMVILCSKINQSEIICIDSQGNKIDNAYNASKPHQLTTSTVETPSADIKSTLTYDTDGNITDISSQKSDGSGKKSNLILNIQIVEIILRKP